MNNITTLLRFAVFLFLQIIAKGKNASELFPAVVKNVASKNIEVFLWLIKHTVMEDLFTKVLSNCI